MQADNLSLPGQAGDLIFVNTSLIHAVTQMSEDGSYASLNFPYAFLPFSWKPHGSGLRPALYRRREILRFLYSPGIRMAKRVDRTAQKITDLFLSNQVKGNEYSICIKIASMWNLLISNFHSSGNSTSINLLRQQRLQSILLFIYAHYADDLQLS